MKTILQLATLLFTTILMAQAPSIEWKKTYGTNIYEYGKYIQQTSDGGYVMLANTSIFDGTFVTRLDICIYKLSSVGAIEWQKTIGGTDVDYANSINQTADGGYILQGYTYSNDGDVTENSPGGRTWLVKLTSLGIFEWQKTYVGGASCLQLTTDEGYIFVGGTTDSVGNGSIYHGNGDFWIVKLSSLGTIEWQKSYGGTSTDYAYSVQSTADGGYIVGGKINSGGGEVLVYHASYDIWMLKLSSSGEMEWQKTLGGMNGDVIHDIKQTSDGGYILACETSSNGIDVSGNHGGIADVWVVKLSNSGMIEWQKTYGGGSYDIAYTIEKTNDGGYILCGETGSTNGDVTGSQGSGDVWIIKISDTGVLQWQKTLGGTSRDDGYGIHQTNDGGYIMIGDVRSNDGDVTGNNGGFDAWVVKFTPELGTTTFANPQYKIFPNPTNQFLCIQDQTNQPIDKITISEITGKIVIEELENLTQVNVQALQQGLYFIQIQSQGKTFTQKFIKE